MNTKQLDGIAEVVSEIIGAAVAGVRKEFVAQIDALKHELSEAKSAARDGRDGKDGSDGKDCDMAAVKAMIDEAVNALPAPAAGKDGANGKDGASVTVGDLQPLMDETIRQMRKDADEAIAEPLRLAEAARDSILKALGNLRQPEDGKSVTLEDVQPMLADAVKGMQDEAAQKLDAAIKSLPAPKDGRDGADGKDGKGGEKGADGAGIADLLTDRDGALVATFTDGRMKNLGVIVGKDGRDGKDGEKGLPGQDGRDGLGFDDLAVEYDGEKTITLKMQRGDVVKEANIVLPINIDRGIFKEGQTYTAGDSVTWGGSYWIAQRATGAKPDSADSGWRLAVKKGRDGKDGRNGIDKTAPVVLKD